MKKFLALAGTLSLLGCSTSNPGIPAQGTYISHITPPASYPARPALQKLIFPHNSEIEGIVVDPTITAYMEQIRDRLLAQWPGVKPDAPIFLSVDEHFSSDVSPAGGMFINAGMIQYFSDNPETQSEDAFAFIIAHELSHILLGHAADKAANQKLEQRFSGASEFGTMVAAAAGGSAIASSAKTALLSLYGAHTLSEYGGFPSWSRSQEEEADTLAVDLMAKAGYSVSVAETSLDALNTADQRDAARAELKAKAAQEKAQQEAEKNQKDNLTAAVLNPILTPGFSLLGSGLNYVGKGMVYVNLDHPHAAERRAELSHYIDRNYADLIPILHKAPFQKWIRSQEVQKFLHESQAINEVADMARTKNWQKTHQLLAGIGSPVRSSQIWLYFNILTEAGLGQNRQAIADLQVASQRDDVILQTVLLWADYLDSQGKTDDALAYLAQEQKLFDDPATLPKQIMIAKKAKKTITVDELVVECQMTGIDRLQQQCSAASKS
ncbi:M48 family metalloprotease [Gluconobacter sphaericus]|uniref:M48 family metalloprotease n=1 Tax=Gluconobacter sphaericus TaxID=574987 RepID=UPI001923CEC4|nr:M48 family metalloprotease [Gluconobacter sphaericus]QQX92085.1 M48 family metalloprotease [Gluconobacter sphaericus]